MNEKDRNPRPDLPATDEEIGSLIRSAGRRPPIPDDDLAALREAGHSAWLRMAATERRKLFRARTAFALAASLMIVALGAWWWLSGGVPGPPGEIGVVELASGRVDLVRAAEAVVVESISAGDSISAGTLLETVGAGEEAGRVALRWAHGESVRLDTGTQVRIVSRSRVELERGALYVDSGPSPVEERLEILTPLGLVREVGTRYEVRVDPAAGAVRVRVREGGVSVERDGELHAAARGDELTLWHDGSVDRAAVEPAGPEWLWVLEAAPGLDIEGRTLASFLEWISRETGREIHYADEELARSASTILLHGTTEGLRPDESIEVVLQGSGLEHRDENGALLVFRP